MSMKRQKRDNEVHQGEKISDIRRGRKGRGQGYISQI